MQYLILPSPSILRPMNRSLVQCFVLLGALNIVGIVSPLGAQEARDTTYHFTTLAGSTTGHRDGIGERAQFHAPEGIALDRQGNVYVTEYRNNGVRKITPDGKVSTLAGVSGELGHRDGAGEQALFNRPHGLTVDSVGNVYVCDMHNSVIRKIAPNGEVVTLAGAPTRAGTQDGRGAEARFNQPEDVAVDQRGTLYVADTYNYTIRRITPQGQVSTLAGQAGTPGSADGPGPEARFNKPVGLAIDRHGTLYVADADYDGDQPGNCMIRKVTPEGRVTTLAGRAGQDSTADGKGDQARFDRPVGIAVAPDGTLYVADTEADLIRKVSPAGVVTTIGGQYRKENFQNGVGDQAHFNDPQAIAIDPDGHLYVADTFNDRIRKASPTIPRKHE